MSGKATGAAVSRSVIAHRKRRRVSAVVGVVALMAMVSAVAFLAPDDRVMAWPAVAIAATVLMYVMVLWSRDGALPMFDMGTLCMLSIGVYSLMPLVGFILMAGHWHEQTDNRLFNYDFQPTELAAFGWRYALYTVSFAAAYLYFRGKFRTTLSVPVRLPGPTTQVAVFLVLGSLYALKLFLKVAYGYDPEGMSYSDLAGYYAAMQSKPYLVRQLGHNVLGMQTAAHQAVLALLLIQWRKRWCRWALFGWLAFEVTTTAVRMGSRAAAVLLLLAAAVLYHRLVRPIGFKTAIAGGSLLFVSFLLAGAIRFGSSPGHVDHLLVGANEFQGLFTTAFDIYKRKELGEFRSVPWQLYISDFVLVIPSQLLPFPKIDGSDWYLSLIGFTGRGVGYMFGVTSQAVLGLDWPEFALRGVVLAGVLALLQRWYARHSSSYWLMLLCLFVSIYTYYTFRASTFYFVYFVVYRWVPFYLATSILAVLLERVRGGARARPAPAMRGSASL
jgi:hypothetical protein